MDLVAGVRKEGSRGGRADFKWEDVKDDQHRENYLGHSLMAPVGRWQKRRDLGWYAKGDDSSAARDAARERAEEITRIKEAEQDALSAALGFAVEPRIRDRQVAGAKEVEKVLKEGAEVEEDGEQIGGKGVGFGGFVGAAESIDTEEKLNGFVDKRGGLEGIEKRKEVVEGKEKGKDEGRERKRHHHSERCGSRHREHKRYREGREEGEREKSTRRRSRSRVEGERKKTTKRKSRSRTLEQEMLRRSRSRSYERLRAPPCAITRRSRPRSYERLQDPPRAVTRRSRSRSPGRRMRHARRDVGRRSPSKARSYERLRD